MLLPLTSDGDRRILPRSTEQQRSIFAHHCDRLGRVIPRNANVIAPLIRGIVLLGNVCK
jgi:hypothetical protein